MFLYTANLTNHTTKSNMFTGIITEIGKVTNIEKINNSTIFSVKTANILTNKKIGESIAVNGACMTVTSIESNSFTFDVMSESLERTNLGNLEKDAEVNLEPALTLNQALDGHMVQGHIDTMGEVENLTQKNDKTILTIKFPEEIAKYLAFKGSITINGVSLTISDLQIKNFSVDLIPHTLEKTNLGKLKKGDKVNLEIDIIARYLERLVTEKEDESKFDFLKRRGFI